MLPTAFATPAALATTPFTPSGSVSSRHEAPRLVRSRRAEVTMVSQTNLAKKQAKVDAVRERLEGCQMLFSTPLDGLTVAQVRDLKDRLPAGTTVATVKNTLMRRAIAESEWDVAGELTKNSSMWFFIEEDFKGSFECYQDFAKETKAGEINGGVFEGEKYEMKGIEAIAALPTKKELLTKIAVSLKMVPTKLARSVNAVPTKLARAIKLAIADESEGDTSAAE